MQLDSYAALMPYAAVAIASITATVLYMRPKPPRIDSSETKAPEAPIDHKVEDQPVVTARELRADAIAKGRSRVAGDSTKHKSLMPGNSALRGLPKILEDVMAPTQQKVEMRERISQMIKAEQEMPTAPFKEDFSHNFFGSQITIGNVTIQNLPKKLHILDITNDQLYIDGQHRPMHTGEIERIKTILRDNLLVKS